MVRGLPFLVLVCTATSSLQCTISTVYNIRIAETTKLGLDQKRNSTTSMTALTLFNQWRTTYRNIDTAIGGGMASLVYLVNQLYARVDCALANVYNETTHYTRTEPDDLLLSAGYTLPLHEKAKITFSGLLGLPTHQDHNLDHIQFGYAHAGVGPQIDGAYIYSDSGKHMVRAAARCIYFIPQTITALNDIGCYQNVRFGYGALTDLFIAHASSFGKHKAEVGYNPTFLYGTTISPAMKDVKARTQYTRHDFYSTYGYSFLVKNISSSVTVALSYGFDSSPQTFGYKRIVNAWALWEINF